MNRREFSFGTLALLPAFSAIASDMLSAPFSKGIVPPLARDIYEPASIANLSIGGILGERITVNLQKRLLAGVDVEVLLAGYRHRPGQQTWIGEHCGKFIDAATHTWALTRNSDLKVKLDHAVRELIATQEPDGYLGTYLPADRWTDWDVWAHKYNMTGLLNYCAYTGYEPALAASRKMGDLLIQTFGDGKRNIAENDPHVGMANGSVLGPMVDLYRMTGDARYLEFSRYIVRAWEQEGGPKILSTLQTQGRLNKVADAKAYEMLSCLVGVIELYRMTGDQQYLRPVEIAWEDAVRNRLYLSGSTSWGERFHEDHWLRADDANLHAGVGEGCVTTTWMQLNMQLLRLTGEARYAAQLERSIYNALIAAQHPESGLVSYFVPLDGCKRHGEVSQGVPGVSCCTSSIPRGIALIPAVAFGVRNGAPVVNLYAPGEAKLRAGSIEVALVSRTRFPEDGDVELTVLPPKRQRFTIALRVPDWSQTFTAKIAEETYTGKPGEYLEITRTWKPAETVHIRLDLTPRVLPGTPSYADSVAVQRGPQILVVEQSLNPRLEIWAAGLFSPVELKAAGERLPQDWRGSQAYEVAGFEGNEALGERAIKVIMVPIADAGQSGAEYRAWLKRS